MRTLRATAVTLMAVLALSACNGSDDPADPMSTWTPSGKIDTPTPTPSAKPTEPALPDAAKKATEAGARAFITHYWSLVDYATATGESLALKKLAGPRCSGCRGGAASIDNVYRAGGHIEASPYLVRKATLRSLTLTSDDRAFEAVVVVRSNGQKTFIPSKETHVTGTLRETFDFTLLHVNGQWRVESLERRP